MGKPSPLVEIVIGIMAVVLLLVAGCELGVQGPNTAATPAAVSAPRIPGPTAKPGVEMVAENLQVPWALAFAPDGRLFFTERPGRLRVIEDGRLIDEPLATLDVAATGEAGLLGLALDPNFSSNGYLYLYHSYSVGAGAIRNRVVRLELVGGQATNPLVLIDGIPGGVIHDGGRIKFGPDGKLYITTGDAANGPQAQDLKSLGGKILRINSDGSIPEDNPFAGSPVYSYGHRNPEGLAWQPGTGTLFETEHGNIGNDEVNIIVKGANYGWPVIEGNQTREGMRSPLLVFNPAIAPSGANFFTGPGAWNGSLLFAALRGQSLFRLVLGGANAQPVVGQERLFNGEFGRLRDVAMGPDGALYFCTNNRDGRGRPKEGDDRILRVRP